MRKFVVMGILGLIAVGAFANPFTGELSLDASSVTFDLSVVTDTIITWFNNNWTAVVSVLVISIGVPFSIRLFKRVLR